MQIDLSNTKSINFDGLEVDILQLNGQTIWNAPKKFSDSTWEEISAISATGNASAYYSIGDEKTITLSTGEEITLMIVGFNHDDKADGSGKAGITIGMKNLLKDEYAWSYNSLPRGYEWKDSSIRNEILPTIFVQLPVDLQQYIVEVNKEAINFSFTIDNIPDRLWLFSRNEINETSLNLYKDEGTQYEYYAKNPNTIKYSNGKAVDWWTRSIDYQEKGNVVYAPSSQSMSGNTDYSSSGSYKKYICFGFCV